MLPPHHRLRRSADFSAVLRRGRRSARSTVVVHYLSSERAVGDPGRASSGGTDRPARVGLVVGKSVGNSVVRHRVSRRLRAILASHARALPPGSDLVVRALPPVTTASPGELRTDLDRAIRRLIRP